MNTIRTLGFAAVAALSLGAGAAMAQESPNDTTSGVTFFGNGAPLMQTQGARMGVQSGSSDVDVRPTSQWHPGKSFDNENNG